MNTLHKIALQTALFSLPFIISSCNNESDINGVPEDKVAFNSYDLHKDFHLIKGDDATNGMLQLKEKYGSFFDFFSSEIVGLNIENNYSDSSIYIFFNHPDFKSLIDTVATVYDNTQRFDKELINLFKRIYIADSNISLPKHVYYYTAGIHHQAFTYMDSIVGIGLDRYFGNNYWPYDAQQIPSFISRNLIPENIPLEAAKVIYNNTYGIQFEDKTLLELMINEGKQLLFLKKVLPNFKESSIIGYTEEQWKWCTENELLIYNFFTKQNLLFERNPIQIMRYIAPAPTSMGMPEQSPGRTASYIGYKILQAYQDKTNKTLQEILIENIDAQTLLNTSKYRPNK